MLRKILFLKNILQKYNVLKWYIFYIDKIHNQETLIYMYIFDFLDYKSLNQCVKILKANICNASTTFFM